MLGSRFTRGNYEFDAHRYLQPLKIKIIYISYGEVNDELVQFFQVLL
jgi:hypothetical protein